MARLVLSDAARVNPLEFASDHEGSNPAETPTVDQALAQFSRSPTQRRRPPARRREPTNASPTTADAASQPAEAATPVIGARRSQPGRSLQTGLKLDPVVTDRLAELVRAGVAPVNAAALTSAVLSAHVPPSPRDAIAVMAGHQADRLRGGSPTTVEVNLRPPQTLRARLDELVRESKRELPGASRSGLISALLARHLPVDATAAATAVLEYRLEQLPSY